MTNEELKKIAKDLHAGRIFCSLNCRNPNDVPMVFMPLALATDKQRKEWEKEGIVFLYEYMDKALPTGINGMPVFPSFHGLNKKQAAKVKDYYDRIKEAVESIK